jgi:hypothetical protein
MKRLLLIFGFFLCSSVFAKIMVIKQADLLDKSIMVESGMSKQELIKTLGRPIQRQFNGAKEAWQYCDGGTLSTNNEFLTVWLNNGSVFKLQSRSSYAGGPCETQFRSINWEASPEPDAIIEIRNR